MRNHAHVDVNEVVAGGAFIMTQQHAVKALLQADGFSCRPAEFLGLVLGVMLVV